MNNVNTNLSRANDLVQIFGIQAHIQCNLAYIVPPITGQKIELINFDQLIKVGFFFNYVIEFFDQK